MEAINYEDEISNRIEALVLKSLITPPQIDGNPRTRNSFLVPNDITSMSVDEIDCFTYWLTKQDTDQIGQNKIRGSSRSEKWVLIDFLICSKFPFSEKTLHVIQLQDFPDFILMKDDKPDVLIEVARVSHQAIEEWNNSTAHERIWKPGDPPKLYSTTPIVKYNSPDERYKPKKIDRGIKNGGLFAGWIQTGSTELQCAERSYQELLSKIKLFNSFKDKTNHNLQEIIVLDVALQPYGLNSNLQIVENGLSQVIDRDQDVLNWVQHGGEIYFRVERKNTASIPYFIKINSHKCNQGNS